LYEIIET
jgi:hypothetical protein